MRKLGIVATFSVMFVLSALAKPETGEGIVAEEQLTDTEVDPDLFRFSVSKLAESIGVKIRGLLGSRSAVDQVREIVDPVSLRYNYYRPVLQVLSTWTARTNYSGLFRVNQPLKPGLINLFVIDHAHLLGPVFS
jgi:hypothetical protein